MLANCFELSIGGVTRLKIIQMFFAVFLLWNAADVYNGTYLPMDIKA
jgi:hypothetical protein